MHEFMPPEPFLVFQQRTCPLHYFRSKTHVFEGFTPFRRCTRPVAETSIGIRLIECFRTVGLQTFYLKDFNALLQVQNSYFGYFSHHFGALQHLFGFAPHTLRLKLVFQVVSRHFVAALEPLQKSVSGALNARVYASETISCFVTMNMPSPLFQSKTHVLGGSKPFRSHT